jgi:hypothetical protein
MADKIHIVIEMSGEIVVEALDGLSCVANELSL